MMQPKTASRRNMHRILLFASIMGLLSAVVRDKDGTLRVLYDRLGIRFQTYEEWVTSGARLPAVTPAY